MKQKKNKKPICPYCNQKAKLITGKYIYPHRKDLYELFFWMCDSCNSFVGCHKGTKEPLGQLANSELRKLRQRVHAFFDPLWKSGKMKRWEAYKLLANKMNIEFDMCHIALFGVKKCYNAMQILIDIKKEKP